MAKKPSVLVAMSGGVDSSVAAALLLRDGWDVTGVFMCLGIAARSDGLPLHDPPLYGLPSHGSSLHDSPSHGASPHGLSSHDSQPHSSQPSGSHSSCCSPQDAADARQVADKLGISFYILNLQRDMEPVVDYFIDEYRRARTPNPCIMCNRRLKFGKLLDYAHMIGAQYVATGHYARLNKTTTGRHLCCGIDHDKDQSYALFAVTREKFKHIMLPLGDHTKGQVRQLARQLDLPVHDKGESQEICFVPDNNYARFIAERAPELVQPGPVVDTVGKELGQHQGIFHYTIGQRRGLGIALGTPAYVVRLDAETNTVVLGARKELLQRRLWADEVNWLVEPTPSEPFEAVVRIRYNHRGAPARVTPLTQHNKPTRQVIVDFAEPISAITPGQAAVFYDGDCVIGGGWIERGQ